MQKSKHNQQTPAEILEDNNRIIVEAYKYQCNEDFENTVENLEIVTNKLFTLIDEIDNHPKVRQILNEKREILSIEQQNHNKRNNLNLQYMQDFQYYNQFVQMMNNQNQNQRGSSNLNKPPKRPWSEEEHQLFVQGYEKFGKKDLKSISDLVQTRDQKQIKSYLQKYLKKINVQNEQNEQNDNLNM